MRIVQHKENAQSIIKTDWAIFFVVPTGLEPVTL